MAMKATFAVLLVLLPLLASTVSARGLGRGWVVLDQFQITDPYIQGLGRWALQRNNAIWRGTQEFVRVTYARVQSQRYKNQLRHNYIMIVNANLKDVMGAGGVKLRHYSCYMSVYPFTGVKKFFYLGPRTSGDYNPFIDQ